VRDCSFDPAVSSAPFVPGPPTVRGKFLYRGFEKLWVRGVTYGTFRPNAEGDLCPPPETVERDFAQMAHIGANAIRLYTVPPRWLLDCALRHGLSVMVGLPWEEHVTFLDQSGLATSIEARTREGVRSCAGHPAVLCFAIGSEIPSSIVRWHGARKIERFLERLCRAARSEDPAALFTYVNYPSTAYLDLPFIDIVAFNLFLESRQRFEEYLPKLHNIADERPLILSEVGLDSLRNGELAQARSIGWQIHSAFAGGCAGTFVFSWTDEWHRGGFDVHDWRFGLTDSERVPKPSLVAAAEAFQDVPFSPECRWPKISVVVCAHNEESLIGDCLDGIRELEYPNFEVIVVDDGSTDATARIAHTYGFKLVRAPHGGLSQARNCGMDAASGEIIAYVDADARPDPHWLHYLAATFLTTRHAAVGGPNLPPPGDGLIADCVASSPGGPIHVLLSDTEAEHIPGCNFAVRKSALQAVGGFDPQFRIAGDDVDVCWRLQQRGWTLGFSPAALVWHRRRNSIRAFWRQQVNYGRAEALLERKWPEKYNEVGHLSWAGRVYGGSLTRLLCGRSRIYQGVWGTAAFQALYHPGGGLLRSLPLMPEWYLILLMLALLGGLGLAWRPLLVAVPLLLIGLGLPLVQAFRSAAAASVRSPALSRASSLAFRAITVLLHMLQPIARLYGRISNGLTPWRSTGDLGSAWPGQFTIWSETWQAFEARLESLEKTMSRRRAVVLKGGEYDRWDLEVRNGVFGAARTRMVVEEHGDGKQLVRFRVWPRCSSIAVGLILLFSLLAGAAALAHAWIAAAAHGALALLITLRTAMECSFAMGTFVHALRTDSSSPARATALSRAASVASQPSRAE
jgi:GT2 family glycosyltransferase